MPRRALMPIAAAAVIIFGAIAWLLPHATEDHDIVAATPAPAGLFDRTTTRLPPGEEACVEPVTFPPEAAFVQVVAYMKEAAPQPLEISARAAGRSAASVVRDYTVGQDAVLRSPLPALDTAATGAVCIRNRGRLSVDLVGTSEPRSLALARPSVDGAPLPGRTIAVSLIEREPRSILDRLDEAVERTHDLTGGLAPELALWILLFAAALGIPAGALLALTLGARDY